MAELTGPRRGLGLTIGITQRHRPPTDTSPAQDALDCAWPEWFGEELPGARFVPIPNLADAAMAVDHAQRWGVNALILSGGEDIGLGPRRDAVESALLDWARGRRCPVLGVCRGMQFLHRHGGGALVEQAGHLGQAHEVHGALGAFTVNSWHRWAIQAAGPDWQALAHSQDGCIEAMRHRSLPWLGLMWHPERGASGLPQVRPLLDQWFQQHT